MDLQGKTILLTGASRGIGSELSKQLVKEKANLILIARKFPEPKLNGNITYINADLTTIDGINKIKNKIKDLQIDILINMAGVGIYNPLEKLSVSDLRKSLELNTIVPFILIKTMLSQLKKSEIGLVLNIGSGAGTMPFAGRSSYCASKYALRGLSLSLSEEFKNRKPRFCLITLGSTMTTFGGKTIKAQKAKIRQGRAIFPVDYVAKELIQIMKSENPEPEIVLFPSEHGFGTWKK